MAAEGPSRVVVNISMYPANLKWFEDLAYEYHLPRSAAIRAALVVAKRHEEEVREAIKLMSAAQHG